MTRTQRVRGRTSHQLVAGLAGFGLLLTGLTATAVPATAGTPTEAPKVAGDNSGDETGYHRSAADLGKPITPEEAVYRAWDWIGQSLTYNQGGYHPDVHGTSYRTDCSGSVSMAWHVEPVYNRGYTTVTISEVSHPISWSEVQPGDGVLQPGHVEMIIDIEKAGVTTFAFGSTPSRAQFYPWSSIVSSYSPIRYDNMQVVTAEQVREKVEEEVRELVETVPEIRPQLDPPGGESITNFGTVFHSGVEPYEETVMMGGGRLPIKVAADPVEFHWLFGDGEDRTTTHAGTTWDGDPGQLIKHEYDKPGNYYPYVEILWTNYRYQLPGRDWTYIDGEIWLTSPSSEVSVYELNPILGG